MSIETKYILGTDGSPDYLVVAEKQELVLAIKGISQPGMNGLIYLGMRVRTVRADGKNIPGSDGKIFVNSWPFPFANVSSHRASFEVVNIVNCSHFQMVDVIKGADDARFAGKAFDYFEENGVTLEVSRSEVREHLHKQWFSEAEEVIGDNSPEFLLTTFVTMNEIKDAVIDEGLTIGLGGTTVNGSAVVWPDKPKAKKAKLKAIKGTKSKGDAEESNVVAFHANKSATEPVKKSGKKKPPPKD